MRCRLYLLTTHHDSESPPSSLSRVLDYLLSKMYMTCICAVTVRSLMLTLWISQCNSRGVIIVQFQKISIPPPLKGLFLRSSCRPWRTSNQALNISLNVLSNRIFPHPQEISISFVGGCKDNFWTSQYIACSRQGQHSDQINTDY